MSVLPGLLLDQLPGHHLGGKGKENDFIILSMVRSNIDDSAGICNDAQWISVALTRARLGFILLCDQEMFRNAGPVWKEALKSYTKLTQSAS